MNKLLAFTAVAEAATGLALVIVPSLVARLLLGAELAGVAVALCYLAGIALLSLGVACWPGRGSSRSALCGLTTYNLLVTVCLSYFGIRGEFVGVLLWPAVGLHAGLTFLLWRGWVAATDRPWHND